MKGWREPTGAPAGPHSIWWAGLALLGVGAYALGWTLWAILGPPILTLVRGF